MKNKFTWATLALILGAAANHCATAADANLVVTGQFVTAACSPTLSAATLAFPAVDMSGSGMAYTDVQYTDLNVTCQSETKVAFSVDAGTPVASPYPDNPQMVRSTVDGMGYAFGVIYEPIKNTGGNAPSTAYLDYSHDGGKTWQYEITYTPFAGQSGVMAIPYGDALKGSGDMVALDDGTGLPATFTSATFRLGAQMLVDVDYVKAHTTEDVSPVATATIALVYL